MLNEWTVEPGSVSVFLRFDPHNPIHADKKEAFESAYGVIVNSNFYGGYSGGLDDESDRVQVFRLGEPIPLVSDRVPTTSKMRLLIL